MWKFKHSVSVIKSEVILLFKSKELLTVLVRQNMTDIALQILNQFSFLVRTFHHCLMLLVYIVCIECTDVADCYRYSVVCVCVYLSVGHNHELYYNG